MPESSMELAHTIFPEMMSHPALFTHSHPKKIAIIGDEDARILSEVLKHANVIEIHLAQEGIQQSDSRIILHSKDCSQWMNQLNPNMFDIIINAATPTVELLLSCFHLLNKEGILIQQSESPFQLHQLKSFAELLQNVGFAHLQILSFPQPNFVSGWRSAFMAIKQGVFKRIHEKAIFNKPFKTQYYNYDVHKAATVLPEFMRNDKIF